MNIFNVRLKELVQEKGKTQLEIAKELQLSKNQLHYWIKGKAEPSIDQLIKLADYFNVCIDYLIGRQDYM